MGEPRVASLPDTWELIEYLEARNRNHGVSDEGQHEFSEQLIVRADPDHHRIIITLHPTTEQDRRDIGNDEAAAFTQDGKVVREGDWVQGPGYHAQVEGIYQARVIVAGRSVPAADLWSAAPPAPKTTDSETHGGGEGDGDEPDQAAEPPQPTEDGDSDGDASPTRPEWG